jgi:hypothetical protein
MRRTANNRWTVYAWNVNLEPVANSSPLSLSSFAYCGYGPVASKATSTVEIRPRSHPSGNSGSATARCPAGTVVVAGGFATTPNTFVFVTGLERVAADLWRVSAWTWSTHTALTSIAYCGPGPAPKLVSRTIKTLTDGPARATCPIGKHLVFGGAIVKGFGDEFLETMRARTQSTWSVGGLSQGRRTLIALAYCR